MRHVATALPDLTALDSEALRELVVEKQTEIENLKLLILKLQRMQFGRSSERVAHDIHQLQLRLEDLETTGASKPTSAVLEAILEPLKRARRPLPAELPRETEILQPKDKVCPDCGAGLSRLGEDVCEVLELVPARFKVIRTVRPKLS